MNNLPLPLQIKIAFRDFRNDPRVTGLGWLLMAGGLCAFLLSFTIGLERYAAASLAALTSLSSLSADAVLALAASVIAVIAFVKEVPSFSQRLTKRGGGQSVAPSRINPDQSATSSDAGMSFNVHSLARKFVLESVTFSIPTDDPKILGAVHMVVESKGTRLYEGAISIGNDLMSGDSSLGHGGYYSVTREVNGGFNGDLRYRIFNYSGRELMCYTVFRVRSVHSLGELLLEKYAPALSTPVALLVRILAALLAFKPDYWIRVRAAEAKRKRKNAIAI